MNTLRTGFLPVAAIALFGLVGTSSVLAQPTPAPTPSGTGAANGPLPFSCPAGQKLYKDANGTKDNFATTGAADPTPHPSPAFVTSQGLNATNIYDQTAGNYHFGETFHVTGGEITKAQVTTNLKPLPGGAQNDGISFSTKTPFSPGHVSYALNWSGPAAKAFVFMLVAGSPMSVNGVASSVSIPANFYTDTSGNYSHDFHIYVQDDTSVDFIQIEACIKPPAPKYDLVASKKHDGNVFVLNVHNAGSQIMPSGHVDVVEVVPAGLIIDSANGSGWQCPGAVFPVVGPDSFTCSYQIPSGGIPANGNLPPIILKSEGKSECPNCMKAKLYLKEVSGGERPVSEGDMKNNASCTM